jgi:hypothetical protein
MECEFSSIREMKLNLVDLQRRVDLCDQAITALVSEFGKSHAAPPARLVVAPGRGVVWRLKARTPGEQTLFVLTGVTGQQFLKSLPRTVCRHYLDCEKRRLTLVATRRVLSYEFRTVSSWISAQQAVNRLSKL